MEPFRTENPEEYLGRTQAQTQKETESTREGQEDFYVEITERQTPEEWGKEGVVSFDLPEGREGLTTRCTIEYDSVHDSNFASYFYRVSYNSKDLGQGLLKQNNLRLRRIKSIKIENGENVLNINDLAPGISIYYLLTPAPEDPKEEVETIGAFAMLKDNLVESMVDPTKILGIFAILHEIGHFGNRSKFTPKDLEISEAAIKKVKFREKLSPEEKALFLKDERTADAFALRTARKFFSNDFIKKIKKFYTHERMAKIHHLR